MESKLTSIAVGLLLIVAATVALTACSERQDTTVAKDPTFSLPIETKPLVTDSCKTDETWEVWHPKYQIQCEPLLDVPEIETNHAGLKFRMATVPTDQIPEPGTVREIDEQRYESIMSHQVCRELGYEGISKVTCRSDCACTDSCTDTNADWYCTADDPTAMNYFGRGEGHVGWGFDVLKSTQSMACSGSISHCSGGSEDSPDIPDPDGPPDIPIH